MSKNNRGILGFVGAVALLFVLTEGAEAISFSNIDPISIPATGTEGMANPYPSTIDVFGLTGTITDVNVTINGLNHTFPDDLDILLVGPDGQKIILLSDAGGPHDITNLTITFDDQAASFPANGDTLVAGSFKPVNYTGNGGPDDIFPAPAPAGPYDSLLSVFNGMGPNGTWRLFVFDDEGADFGRIANGWSLDVITGIPEPSTIMLLAVGLLVLVVRGRNKKLQR